MREVDPYPAIYDLFCEFISADEIKKIDGRTGKPYKLKIVKGMPKLVEEFKKRYVLMRRRNVQKPTGSRVQR